MWLTAVTVLQVMFFSRWSSKPFGFWRYCLMALLMQTCDSLFSLLLDCCIWNCSGETNHLGVFFCFVFFFKVWWPKWRCRGPLLSDVIICITSASTTALRRDTRTSQSICHPASGVKHISCTDIAQIQQYNIGVKCYKSSLTQMWLI